MGIIKNPQTINTGEDGEGREPSYTVGRNVIGTVTIGNSIQVP